MEYLVIFNLRNKLSNNRVIYLEQFHPSQPNSNNKIIYLDKRILNYLVSHSRDSNNNKHLYLASNLFKPHLNKEVCLARHYHNSHSSFSKHNLNNNNQYFSFKIDKKDKHLYLEAWLPKHRLSNKHRLHKHCKCNKDKINHLMNNNLLLEAFTICKVIILIYFSMFPYNQMR